MLKEREQLILKEIIDSYVDTALPVGSQTLARRLSLGLSAATIRNTMMDLEEQGYLGQPHTSAGRIPTDLAYRTYVDDWLEPEPLTEPELQQLEASFGQVQGDLTSLLEQAARLLGGVCHHLGLALAPSFGASILTGLEFVRVADQRVLVILRVRDGLVKTVLLDVSTNLDADMLAATAARLNESLVGLTLEEIRATLQERARSWNFGDEEIVARLVALGPGLFSLGEPSALYVRGAGEIVSQPEFQVPERLQELLRAIDDRPGLSQLLEERRAHPGVRITIGHENTTAALSCTSIVTCTWSNGALSGTVGVIGPTRMHYRRVVGHLHQIVRQIDRRLNA